MREMVVNVILYTCIAFLIVIAILFGMCIYAMAQETEDDRQIESNEPIFVPMEATAYCYGTKTSTGVPVRRGIAAAASKYSGMTACVYENIAGKPGDFLGYYEILDTGGDYRIKNGTVIDIYMPDYNDCIKFGRKNVLVVFVNGKG